MNFLFTVALNNTKTANGYKTIYTLFNTLGNTLSKLGHKVYLIYNRESYVSLENSIPSLSVLDFNEYNIHNLFEIIDFKPDHAFIWNGNLDCDQITINALTSIGVKLIYGELGFFDHYNKTCYFDLNGVNAKSSLMTCKLQDIDYNIDLLVEKHKKERLFHEPYIFVPLQIESDTQITHYSPFKDMNVFLKYVSRLFQNDDRKILVKKHPRSSIDIVLDDKMIEVYEDVHHYIPYADLVVGINSTVLTETLLYHSNIITCGVGLTSRHIDENHRKHFVHEIFSRQMYWDDLNDENKVKNCYFYRTIMGFDLCTE